MTSPAALALRRSLLRAVPSLQRDLPWIGADPWPILVSEFMLQQTQTSRVLPLWRNFLHRFPTPASCAEAPLAEVLRYWEGLGFHRRARFVHEAAIAICRDFGGSVPRTVNELRSLPGVGPYTANAVASFAFNEPTAVVDTNVGRVLARALANRQLTPVEAQTLAEEVVPKTQSAVVNQALLDLGAQFCTSTPRCDICPLRRVCVWHRDGGDDPAVGSAGVSKPQSRFEGSDRQLRGRVLAQLRQRATTMETLIALVDEPEERVRLVLAGLERDLLISQHRGRWVLGGPTDKVPT